MSDLVFVIAALVVALIGMTALFLITLRGERDAFAGWEDALDGWHQADELLERIQAGWDAVMDGWAQAMELQERTAKLNAERAS